MRIVYQDQEFVTPQIAMTEQERSDLIGYYKAYITQVTMDTRVLVAREFLELLLGIVS